jgi:hypothetical protein
MRVNVYAEEMTSPGMRFYLELPVTMAPEDGSRANLVKSGRSAGRSFTGRVMTIPRP